MSQGFPPSAPESGPGVNYRGPQRDPLDLARRASVILFILGGLVGLHGIGNCASAFTFSGEELIRQNQQMLPTSQPSGGLPQLSPTGTKVVLGVGGGVELLIGLGIMLLGSPVRRGRSWAITTSMVAVSVIGAFGLLMLVVFLVLSALAPAMLGVACILVVPTVLCGLSLKWLIQVMQTLPLGPPAIFRSACRRRLGCIDSPSVLAAPATRPGPAIRRPRVDAVLTARPADSASSGAVWLRPGADPPATGRRFARGAGAVASCSADASDQSCSGQSGGAVRPGLRPTLTTFS